MNAWLEERCIEQWARLPHGMLPGTIAEAWAAERAALMPTPPTFDGFVEQSKRVSRSSAFIFSAISLGIPARLPLSIWAFLTHSFRVCAV